MPRHTHPAPVRKHDRGHIREQRSRFIRRNWQRAKARHDRHWGYNLHPELARQDPTHPDAWWPFTLAANELTRNPFNQCSCWMCSRQPEDRRLQRHREAADWRAHVREEVSERDTETPQDPRVRHSVVGGARYERW